MSDIFDRLQYNEYVISSKEHNVSRNYFLSITYLTSKDIVWSCVFFLSHKSVLFSLDEVCLIDK
jgi:hypothetical protein